MTSLVAERRWSVAAAQPARELAAAQGVLTLVLTAVLALLVIAGSLAEGGIAPKKLAMAVAVLGDPHDLCASAGGGWIRLSHGHVIWYTRRAM